MSVRVTDSENVAMYDSVSGRAFGPIFASEAQCDEFQEWLKDRASGHHTVKYGNDEIFFLADPRIYRSDELAFIYSLWRMEG